MLNHIIGRQVEKLANAVRDRREPSSPQSEFSNNHVLLILQGEIKYMENYLQNKIAWA